MFTGIIKAIGTIEKHEARDGDIRLSVGSDGLPWPEYTVGDSISVNGVCLTAIELSDSGFLADVSVETMDVTALGELAPGSRVNLEPALAVGDRIGGHFVSGHVDCVGVLKERNADARSVRMSFEIPPEYRRYTARKGSICIDGVSLTINDVSDAGFELNIIPHTAEATTLGAYATGQRVNVEIDLLARYLERLMSDKIPSGVELEFLREHGYA
jgi:riboflavin synthase